jgi:hypothetical protein
MAFDKMTNTELAQFLATLQPKWHEHGKQARDCTGGKSCQAQLSAIDGQQEISPDDAEGNGFGTVVVRMQNLAGTDKEVENMYALKGGAFKYYMIAHKASATTMSWTLHEVPNGGTATEISHGTWTACDKYDHDSARLADAMFATCAKAHVTGDTAKKNGKKKFDDPTDPAWMTCVDGCCTAGNPELQAKKP